MKINALGMTFQPAALQLRVRNKEDPRTPSSLGDFESKEGFCKARVLRRDEGRKLKDLTKAGIA